MAKAVLEGKIQPEDDIRKYLNEDFPNLFIIGSSKKKTEHYTTFQRKQNLIIWVINFLNSGEILSAIKIFKLLVSEFPQSSNSYDSLGEAYFKNKEYTLSQQNYQKSLELNPSNHHAREMLKQM
jgi:tetratricopeptide (TPR) repeat protein